MGEHSLITDQNTSNKITSPAIKSYEKNDNIPSLLFNSHNLAIEFNDWHIDKGQKYLIYESSSEIGDYSTRNVTEKIKADNYDNFSANIEVFLKKSENSINGNNANLHIILEILDIGIIVNKDKLGDLADPVQNYINKETNNEFIDGSIAHKLAETMRRAITDKHTLDAIRTIQSLINIDSISSIISAAKITNVTNISTIKNRMKMQLSQPSSNIKTTEDQSYRFIIPSIYRESWSHWIQIIGNYAKQKNIGVNEGYGLTSYGFTLGMDKFFREDTLLGLSFGYERSSLRPNNSSSASAVINYYQLSAYGNLDINDNLYLISKTGYSLGYNSLVQEYNYIFNKQEGSYYSNQWNTYIELGYSFNFNENFTITPSINNNLNYYYSESFTMESVNDGTTYNQFGNISQWNYQLGVGLDFDYEININEKSKLTPSLSLGYSYELFKPNTLISLTPYKLDNTYLIEGNKFGREIYNIQSEIVYIYDLLFEAKVILNMALKDKYFSKGGSLELRYRF